MKLICHITTVHPRTDGRVFEKECKSLAQTDYTVALIVADGLGNDELDGVNVVDLGKSKFGRFGRLIITSFKALKKSLDLKAQIYHFHDPELIPIGLMLKVFGKNVVYDIHENLPLQILHKHWIPKILRDPISKLFAFIESFACKYFDALIVPQPSMKLSYSKVNANTELIANFVDIKRISKSPKQYNDKKRYSNSLVHLGGLTQERGLFNMLNVLTELDESFSLILAGPINNTITKQKCKNHKEWRRVSYRGYISQSEVEAIYEESSIGLILYNNVGQYYLSYAIKLFEFMAKGIPVIMPNFGEWPAFNDQYKVGICVDVCDAKAIAKAITTLVGSPKKMEQLSLNGIKAIKEKFNWDNEAEKLLNVYEGILNDK